MALPMVGRKIGLYDTSASPAVLIAGVQSKSASINNAPVDITSDDDAGFRKLLSDPGTQSLDLSVEGIIKDTTLMARAIAGTALMEAAELRILNVGTIAGTFFLASFELGAPTSEGSTFSASLQSSGSFTYTASP